MTPEGLGHVYPQTLWLDGKKPHRASPVSVPAVSSAPSRRGGLLRIGHL